MRGRIGGRKKKKLKQAEKQPILDAKQVIFGPKPQHFQNTEATLGFHITASLLPNRDPSYYKTPHILHSRPFLNFRPLQDLHQGR